MEKRYKMSQDIIFKAGQEFMLAGNEKKYKLPQDITFKEGDEFTLGGIEEIQKPWATDEDISNIMMKILSTREATQIYIDNYKKAKSQ